MELVAAKHRGVPNEVAMSRGVTRAQGMAALAFFQGELAVNS